MEISVRVFTTFIVFVVQTVLLLANTTYGQYPAKLEYVNPLPGAREVSPLTTLIFKSEDEKVIRNLEVEIEGNKSGLHKTQNKRVTGNTVIFNPDNDFSEKEAVDIRVSLYGERIYSYRFFTGEIPDKSADLYVELEQEFVQNHTEIADDIEMPARSGDIKVINGISVPSDFPQLKVSINEAGSTEGVMFMSTYYKAPYLIGFGNDGTPLVYKKLTDNSHSFKLQQGRITYRITGEENIYGELDNNLELIDTYECENGYYTDPHEFFIMPDGHYFLIGTYWRSVDMSKIVAGGNADAYVLENIIQEFDADKNLIFEWRAMDHYKITDAHHLDLTSRKLDYVHMNSVCLDYDGNILVSSRNLDEITKINRSTGEIIWRLGGKNNEFNFTNDEYELAYQHHARPVEGKPGEYTLFDNGNFREPYFSRGLQLRIDTINKTAEKVWEFRHSPSLYSPWMGSVQVLNNGNKLINFASGLLPKAVEVTPSGETVYEADFVNNIPNYRTHKYEFTPAPDKPYLIAESLPNKVQLIFNFFGKNDIEKFVINGRNFANGNVILDTTVNPYYEYTDLENGANYLFWVNALDNEGNISENSNFENVIVNYIPLGTNYIQNGDFSNGDTGWTLDIREDAVATAKVNDSGTFYFDINEPGSNEKTIRLHYKDIPLLQGRDYSIEFDAYAEKPRLITVMAELDGKPETNYSRTSYVELGVNRKHYSYEFHMEDETDYHSQLSFYCGKYDGDVFIDNVSLVEFRSTGIEEKNNKVPVNGFSLSANYPNPFNPETNISYTIPERSDITLTVYNMIGEKVAVLAEETVNGGTYKKVFSGKNLPSGVYLYNLSAKSLISGKEFNSVHKMILLK